MELAGAGEGGVVGAQLVPKKGRFGPAPALHNCGPHGHLTVRQIAELVGCDRRAIYLRIENGVTGIDLCRPLSIYHGGAWKPERAPSTIGNMTIAMAVSISRRWPKRAPTVAELREHYGMHRATAYRWRAAFIDAGALG